MLTIKTNNKPRFLVYGYELTEKEKSEFDWMEKEELETAEFFRYKNRVYAVSEFLRVPEDSESFKGWDGYSSDSFFSGVIVKFCDDCESVIIGTYFS